MIPDSAHKVLAVCTFAVSLLLASNSPLHADSYTIYPAPANAAPVQAAPTIEPAGPTDGDADKTPPQAEPQSLPERHDFPVRAAQTQAPSAGPDAASTPDFLKSGDTELVEDDDADTGNPAQPEAQAQAEGNDFDKGMLGPVGGILDKSLGAPIEKNIHYFSGTIKNRFSSWLSRSGKYVELMKGIFRENYLPEDLVFLSLIESGFNPKAYSWARASGPWQFIRGTAKKYGLRVDRWVDERRDPVKSTKAAAAYLKDLYGMFGSWPLAMASYNAGEGNISRAVNRNGTDDFWELRKTRSLPAETKDYIPKFVAAKMIAQNPGDFGFDGVQYEQPLEFDEVALEQCTDLSLVAKCCDVDVEQIKELNPELMRSCTPPNSESYTIKIPKGTKEKFEQAYAQLSDEEKTAHPPKDTGERGRHYVAKRGDTVKRIAKKFHVTPGALADANDISASAKLKAGQRLTIPGRVYIASNAHARGRHHVRRHRSSIRVAGRHRGHKGRRAVARSASQESPA